MIPKIVYCPKCKNIIRPKIKVEGELNIQTGFITVECGNIISFNGGKKLVKCSGKVKIKTEKQEA